MPVIFTSVKCVHDELGHQISRVRLILPEIFHFVSWWLNHWTTPGGMKKAVTPRSVTCGRTTLMRKFTPRGRIELSPYFCSVKSHLFSTMKCTTWCHVSFVCYPWFTGQDNNISVLHIIRLCFLPIHSGHTSSWTYQPGPHRRKVTQDFSSTFFLRCVP